MLAVSGGAIDTISFITLFGLFFTAHVTGNLVVAGASLAGDSEGIVAKLLAIPAFMVAVAATTLIIKTRKRITPAFSCRVVYGRSVPAAALCFTWLYMVAFY